MSYRALDDSQIEEAQQLRNQGLTNMQIGESLGVSTKTIQRALGPKQRKQLAERIDEWPVDRLWPKSWNAKRFRDSGLGDEAAEVHWAIVQGAVHSNNQWLQWFERSWIELRDELMDESLLISTDPKEPAANWFDALAGLPVLCEWLGGSRACAEIKAAAMEYRPWVSSPRTRKAAEIKPKGVGKLLAKTLQHDPEVRSRIGFRSAVRTQTQELTRLINKQQLMRAVTMPQESTPGLSPVFVLNGLLERIPMFDMHPKRSSYAKFGIWQMYVGLFSFEPIRNK